MSDIDAARAEEARSLAISTAQAHVTRAIDATEEMPTVALTVSEKAHLREAEEALQALWFALERRRGG